MPSHETTRLPRYLYYSALSILFIVGIVHVLRHFIDYPVYELASRKLFSGKTLEIYDLNRNYPGGYYYPYFFALSFSLFALLPSLMGKFLFFLVFFISYLHILHFSLLSALKLSNSEKPWPYLPLFSVLLTSYALNDAFMNANIGILLLSLVILAFNSREKNPALSGFYLAVAITFKMYPLFLLGFFIWARLWKVVLFACLGVFFLYILLPIVLEGPSTGITLLFNQFYVASHFGNHWSLDGHIFQNIPATVIRYSKLLGGSKEVAYPLSLILSLFLVTLYFLKSFWQKLPVNDPDFVLRMFIFSLALVPLIIPVSWYNMALFYTPLIACLLAEAFQKNDLKSKVALICYSLLYCLTTPDLVGTAINTQLAFFAVPFFGILSIVLTYAFDTVQKFPLFFYTWRGTRA